VAKGLTRTASPPPFCDVSQTENAVEIELSPIQGIIQLISVDMISRTVHLLGALPFATARRVIGAAFLLTMNGTLAGIHIEHDAVGAIQRLGLPQHVPGSTPSARSDSLLWSAARSRTQCKVEVSAAPRSQILCELINRNVGSTASCSASLRSS